MRKIPLLLIGVILILSSLTISLFSYAEDNHILTKYDEILAQEELYHLFHSPEKLSYDGSRMAIYDNGRISIYDGVGFSYIDYPDNIAELLLIDDLLLIRNEYDMEIVKVSTGEIVDNQSVLSIVQYPKSLAIDYDNNKLYVLGITGIRAFDVSDDEIIYDDTFSIDNNLLFESNSITYNKDTLYIYKVSNRIIYEIPLDTLDVQTLITNLPSDTTKIIASDDYIMALLQNDKSIIRRYSKSGDYIDDILETSNENKDNKVKNLSDISLYKNSVYIADSDYAAIKVYDLDKAGLTYLYMYGSYGSGLRRLNNPSSVTVSRNNIYIADTLNNRVVKYQLDNNKVIASPSTIGSYGDENGQFINPLVLAADYSSGLYVADSTGRLQYFLRDSFVNSFEFQDISSIAISGNDRVFVVDRESKAIYSKSKSDLEFNKMIELDRVPIDITISKSGSVIYIADDIGIWAYSLSGNLLDFSIQYSDYGIDEINSIAVDFSGNMYLLSSGGIYRFERTLFDYSLSNVLELDNGVALLGELQGMIIAPDGRILIADASYHKIISIAPVDSLAVTENDIEFNHPTDVIYPSRIAYTLNKATLYNNPNNYEDIDTIDKDVAVLVLNDIRYDNINYYYIEYQGKKTYISQNDTVLLRAGTPNIDYVKSLHPNLDIYLYPSPNAPKVISNLGREEIIKVISNVGEREGKPLWNWYEVEYLNHKGYVLKTEIIPASLPTVKDTKYYAKIKSNQFGHRVNLYALEDTHSTILVTLGDGSKVELIAPLDKDSRFTLINYEDYSGYILTENLVEDGLTTGQILSIVLACMTFGATIIVIVISRVIKRESQ